MPKRLPDEIRAQVIELGLRGLTIATITEELGISAPTVGNILKGSPEYKQLKADRKAAKEAGKVALQEDRTEWGQRKAAQLELDRVNAVRWRAEAEEGRQKAITYRQEGLHESASFELRLAAQQLMLADWMDARLDKELPPYLN